MSFAFLLDSRSSRLAAETQFPTVGPFLFSLSSSQGPARALSLCVNGRTQGGVVQAGQPAPRLFSTRSIMHSQRGGCAHCKKKRAGLHHHTVLLQPRKVDRPNCRASIFTAPRSFSIVVDVIVNVHVRPTVHVHSKKKRVLGPFN